MKQILFLTFLILLPAVSFAQIITQPAHEESAMQCFSRDISTGCGSGCVFPSTVGLKYPNANISVDVSGITGTVAAQVEGRNPGGTFASILTGGTAIAANKKDNAATKGWYEVRGNVTCTGACTGIVSICLSRY